MELTEAERKWLRKHLGGVLRRLDRDVNLARAAARDLERSIEYAQPTRLRVGRLEAELEVVSSIEGKLAKPLVVGGGVM